MAGVGEREVVFGFKFVAEWRAVDRHVCVRRANRQVPLLLSKRDQGQSAFVAPSGTVQ